MNYSEQSTGALKKYDLRKPSPIELYLFSPLLPLKANLYTYGGNRLDKVWVLSSM